MVNLLQKDFQRLILNRKLCAFTAIDTVKKYALPIAMF